MIVINPLLATIVPDSTTGQVGHNQPDVLPIVHRGATVVHQESQPEQPINQTCPLTRFGPRSHGN